MESEKTFFEEERNLLLQELAEQISKREIAEKELKTHELLLQKTELIANIGYWNLNLNSNTFSGSEGARRIYGIDQQIITLEDVRSARLPEYNELLDNALKDLITENKTFDVTYKIKRKSDNAILNIHSKADYHKESNHIFGIISDITEQVHQIEQILEIENKWKGVIESTPVPMAINDNNGQITFLNSAFTKVFGYNKKDIPTIHDWFNYAYPDPVYREETSRLWHEKLDEFKKTGVHIPSMEFEITCKNGDKKSILISTSWLGDSNEKNQLIILYDITERKILKEKELEYLQVLEGVLNSINVRVFWKDKDLNYLGCNNNFAKDAGFNSTADIIGKNDFDMGWKDQAELYQSDDSLVIKNAIPKLNIEEPQTTPDGKTITLLTNKIPLLNTKGEINGVIGTYLDITERKDQEIELAKSQMYFQAVLQSTNDGILAVSLDGKVLYANDKFSEITSIPKSIIHNGRDFDLLNFVSEHIEDGLNFRKEVESSYSSNEVKIETIKFKNGKTIERHTQPLILANETIGRVWSLRDITKRVLAEAKVRQKDIEFQKLSLNVSDLIYQFTRRPDGTYFVPIASQGIKNIFGCNPEDVIDNFEPIAKVIHPDDMERVIDSIEDSAKNLSIFKCEFRVQIPGKEVQWIYSKSNPELLPDGSVTWYGFNTDITFRIKAEEKLLQLSEAVEQSPVTIVITDLEGKIQYANPTFTKTTGYTIEEAIGQNPRILKSGKTDPLEYKKLWKTISSGKKWTGEFQNKSKNGNLFWESATIAPVIDKKGIIKNYMAIKMDITESKMAQLALEESNNRYNLISKATHDTIWDLDLVSGRLILSGNDSEKSLITPFLQTQSDWINLIHPEDLNEFTRTQQMALDNPQTHFWEHEYRMLNTIGQFSYVNSKGYIVRDEQGIAIRIIGASQDISERMIHIKAIEAQNKQLQEIAWIQSHIVRAPLARIMGLINLLKIEDEIPDDLKTLLQYILTSANEFDEIIKTISNKSQVVELK
jgi:PAS domain S-box-containing protein